MSERINTATTAYAARSAIQSGVGAAVTSIRYDRAVARQATALDRYDAIALQRARSRVAARNVRIILGI